ncbi:uncharacterized protein LOC125006421 [Mugil cephalus]|uniref:uncharacterized protein LOC125006421 n=1 Tax=Mugil cephalus TaxID=48193 RepID=UPI001FB7903B|nr:uncharacterized protein LOC125006421 [Mugil cephalus]
MFLPGWPSWCVLLTLCMSACDLEASEVTCSQVLSECTVADVILPGQEENNVKVQSLKSEFHFCRDRPCTFCLEVNAELDIQPDEDKEEEDHSGSDDEDYSNPNASVTVCYQTPSAIPTCKKVEFTVNHTALTHQNQAKISMVITKPYGFPFGSEIQVYPYPQLDLIQKVVAPSPAEVCSRKLKKCIPQCQVPTVRTVIDETMNQVELQFEASNKSLPTVCVQYEANGRCQGWNKLTIPLYSVTPCTCLQVWHEDGGRSTRSQHCPFKNTSLLQNNIWKNVSVSVRQDLMNNDGTKLSWNLTAPCRLEGEVWLWDDEISCKDKLTCRQQLENGPWKQNRRGLWRKKGVFENITPKLSPCVMVQVKGMEHKLGPFCVDGPGRWRWSLLVVGVMLVVCLTVIIFYFLRDFVKKWAWSWHHGGFVKVGRKGHVVLLSPPDADALVSQSVCQLGSLLCSQGFSVCVDQWSRKEQCNLGPLPWLHSHLLKINSMGGRVVLVLTHKALARIEEWSHCNKDVVTTNEGDRPRPQIWSPYSDLFTASLFHIYAEKQKGKSGERFLLVEFDSQPTKTQSGGRRLPELVRGLSLFRLPSQTESLFTELTVTESENGSGRRTWKEWTWGNPQCMRV